MPPDLTLADVQELDRRISLAFAIRHRRGVNAIRRQVLIADADGRLADVVIKHGEALLALAREALERRNGETPR